MLFSGVSFKLPLIADVDEDRMEASTELVILADPAETLEFTKDVAYPVGVTEVVPPELPLTAAPLPFGATLPGI
jgi:hypothetical protein